MINENDIRAIVSQIINEVDFSKLITGEQSQLSAKGEYGVYDKVEDAIDAGFLAQKEYMAKCNMEARVKIVKAVKEAAKANVKEFALRAVEETGLGRVEDKITKNLVVIEKTPGPECLTTTAISSDDGLMIEEYAPFGLIGSVTPVTNPTATIINNTVSMISAGNAVVFNVHPSAKKVCAYCLQILNKAIIESGGPKDLITMVKEPTLESVQKISSNPKIRLMVGTGGMPMVTQLLKSGKKTIGAGAGNPPVVIDETADIKLAAREIFEGASFDNNLLCLAEKEVFVVKNVYDKFINEMKAQGAYLLNQYQLETAMNLIFTKDESGYHVSKKWVGQDAGKLLKELGVDQVDAKLIICETDAQHPLVLLEQLMPVLPIVRCEDFEQAMNGAVKAESGNRHTSSIFSTNVVNMTKFAKAIETTIYTKNGSTLRGVGIGGNGHTTMTIAGPTGEGITSAKSFSRIRRCMLAEGGFRIV